MARNPTLIVARGMWLGGVVAVALAMVCACSDSDESSSSEGAGGNGPDAGVGGSSGGAGKGSGGSSGSAGSSTGGHAGTAGAGGTANGGSSGSAGSAGAAGGQGGNPPSLLWSDSIQAGPDLWGFDGMSVQHPIDNDVTPDDANGANLSRVADPLGVGFALRHFATFDSGGSRAQLGLYGDVNTAFGQQATSADGVWVAQEWFFPDALGANGDLGCWINLWDFHSINADRSNRWHTAPGLILARDGTMRVQWEWGGAAGAINQASGYSSIPLPVNQWFDIEMHYQWRDSTSATLSLWINGELALEQAGVQTRASSHAVAETYVKFYGATSTGTPWTPTRSVKYTRNVRVAAQRIWQ